MKILRLLGALCACIITLVISTAHAESTFTLVADATTSLPGGSGNNLVFYPVASGGEFSFKNRLSGTQIGIYRTVGGVIELVPGSIYQFHFDHSFDGTSVAFRAKNNNLNTDGIYTDVSGNMVQIINRNTPVPGGSGPFNLSFEDPWISNGITVFRAVDPNQTNFQSAIWKYDGTALSLVAGITTPVPGGGSHTFFQMDNAAIDTNGTIAFLGSADNPSPCTLTFLCTEGIYKLANGTLELVANIDIQIPGGVGGFERVSQPSLDQGNIAFRGIGSNGQIGIYSEISGQLSQVADLTTAIPDGPGTFTQLTSAAISGRNIAFVGRGGASFSHRGIYVTTPDEQIAKVIDNQDTLSGKAIQDFRVRKQSLDGSNLLFGVTFTDGSRAIYVTQIEVTPIDALSPTADAGTNQAIHASQTVNLDGTGSFDDTTASVDLLYTWSFSLVPAGSTAVLVDASTANASFVADVPGTFNVDLVVEDEAGNVSDPDTVEISSENVAPEANAGDDQVIIIATTAILDGTDSSDADFDSLSFSWTIAGAPIGSTAVLVGSATDAPTLTPDLEGIFTVDLVVNDGFVDSAPDSVLITVVTGEEFAEMELMDANDVVTAIPVEDLQAPGHSQSLTNAISQIINFIQNGQISQAINKLDDTIERTDGCPLRSTPDPMGAGNNEFAGDWVTDCTEQAALYDLLISTKAALELL